MPKQKQNRKPGIHLHRTAWKSVSTGKYCEYYWILIAKNGKTIAEGKPCKRKGSAVRSIRIAANIFYQAEGAVGFNFFDHSTGSPINDFVVF